MNEAETNPNMENKCPQCGAPLPSGVLAGLCPACLMKQGATADTAVPPDTASFQPPSVEEIAKLFPQLEIIALIGKGGMGAVYRARQPALDRIVALKILPPQTAGGPGFVERFNREARALAKLNHPNIVAVYEFGQVNGLPFFIMEFVDGLNLRQLERAGKLSPREALQIVPQICEALQFAHDEGIVHRDIKPENILLDKKGRVKIADFGIAKILGNAGEVDLTGTQGAIGTPHYMAPEQMEKPTTVDHRADIFSLGVVFYEMLTGELPLGKFAPPSSRKLEVDVRLDDVVLRTLEKDPERRYQHASQVKTAVDTIAGSATPPPSATDAEALVQAILARDYNLNIRSCLRRGWKLLTGEFWPFVGITALIMALLAFVSAIGGATIRDGPAGHNSAEISSALAMLVWGPLVGGLFSYYLKKIRREKTTVETAFTGFSQGHRFLHLCHQPADLAGISLFRVAGNLSADRVDVHAAAGHGQAARFLVGDGIEPQGGDETLV
jgi:predicted Ser/Thr protein kinase